MIHVVAGVVIDAADRVLIAQRPPGKHLAGGWEFPGGKLEAGEERISGLARELREELGIEIGPVPRPLIRHLHGYERVTVLLDVFIIRQFSGVPLGLDGQALRWCSFDELLNADLLPADEPIVRALRLPERLRHLEGIGYRVVEPSEVDRQVQAEYLIGVICTTASQAISVAGAGAAFLVFRGLLSKPELASLCSHVSIPVFVRGLQLTDAWHLGASGIDEIA